LRKLLCFSPAVWGRLKEPAGAGTGRSVCRRLPSVRGTPEPDTQTSRKGRSDERRTPWSAFRAKHHPLWMQYVTSPRARMPRQESPPQFTIRARWLPGLPHHRMSAADGRHDSTRDRISRCPRRWGTRRTAASAQPPASTTSTTPPNRLKSPEPRSETRARPSTRNQPNPRQPIAGAVGPGAPSEALPSRGGRVRPRRGSGSRETRLKARIGVGPYAKPS